MIADTAVKRNLFYLTFVALLLLNNTTYQVTGDRNSRTMIFLSCLQINLRLLSWSTSWISNVTKYGLPCTMTFLLGQAQIGLAQLHPYISIQWALSSMWAQARWDIPQNSQLSFNLTSLMLFISNTSFIMTSGNCQKMACHWNETPSRGQEK